MYQVFSVATLVIKSRLEKRDQKAGKSYYFLVIFVFKHCVPPAIKQDQLLPELNTVLIQDICIKHKNIKDFRSTHNINYAKYKTRQTFLTVFKPIYKRNSIFQSRKY